MLVQVLLSLPFAVSNSFDNSCIVVEVYVDFVVEEFVVYEDIDFNKLLSLTFPNMSILFDVAAT